jgi:predicted nucleic acid-binding protein
MAFVVDASVTLKWFLADEEDRTSSLALLKTVSAANHPLVPCLWFYEIGSALNVAVRRKRIAVTEVDEILRLLEQMPIDVDTPSRPRSLQLPTLAREHSLTTYDAAYLELAMRRRVPLATADMALKKAAAAESVALI